MVVGPFIRVVTYTTKDFATLEQLELLLTFTRAYKTSSPIYTGKLIFLTFWHRSGFSPYTSPYGFAETCVCGKQPPCILLL